MSGSLESVRWNACVHRIDLGLYSHSKAFRGNGFKTRVNSKGKIHSTGKILHRRVSNPRRCIKHDKQPNTLPTSYSGPQFKHQICTTLDRQYYTKHIYCDMSLKKSKCFTCNEQSIVQQSINPYQEKKVSRRSRHATGFYSFSM